MRSIRPLGICGVVVVLTLLAASFLATSVATAASTSIGAGGIGIRLIPDASSPSSEPLALSYIVERLAPGSQLTRQIEISNTTDAMADVVVFPAAASIAEGKFSFAPGRSADPLSSWTTVAHPVLHIAPGATALDAVTINVARNSSSGERYAVVWAEVSAPSPTHSGVRLVNRVGIRMYLSVGEGGLPAAEFNVGSLATSRSANGSAVVTAQVHNVGQAALDITGELTLSRGPGGLSAGPFPVMPGTMLAPGHFAAERVELDGAIPLGPWRGDLSLWSDGTQRSSASMITFPANRLTDGRRSLTAPLSVAALVFLMLLVTAVSSIVFFRRRHLRRARRRHSRLDRRRRHLRLA